MRGNVAAHLTTLARRGQWHRCLELLQHLTSTQHTAVTQTVLHHPSVLRHVLQAAPSSAQARYSETARAVLLLCGEALRASLGALPVKSTAAVQSNAGDTLVNRQPHSSPRAKPCDALVVVKETAPAGLHTPQQRHEWRLLVTAVLQAFKAAGSAEYSGTSAPVGSGASDESIGAAVVGVCAWAEQTHLGVNEGLLREARALAGNAVKAAVTATTAKREGSLPQREADRAETPRSVLVEGGRAPRAGSSRVTYRLTTAWNAATASLLATVERTYQSESEMRRDFQRAVGSLSTPADATAAADCVLSFSDSLSHHGRHGSDDAGANPPPSDTQPTGILRCLLFCSLCEEVLCALQDKADQQTVRSADDTRGVATACAALESQVVVSAAELAVVQSLPARLVPGSSTDGDQEAAECHVHTARALRHLCSSLCQLWESSATRTPPPWLVEKLRALSIDRFDTSAPPAVRLLRLVVVASAAHTLSCRPLTRGDAAVAAAVGLVESAMTEETHSNGAAASASASALVRAALQLPLPQVHPSKRQLHGRDPVASPLDPPTARFVCAVLNGCRNDVAAALLTASAVSDKLTPAARQTLSVSAQHALLAALCALRRCLANVCALHNGTSLVAVSAPGAGPASSPLSWLSCVLSSLCEDCVIALTIKAANRHTLSSARGDVEDASLVDASPAVLRHILAYLPSDVSRATAAQEALQAVCSAVERTDNGTTAAAAHAVLLHDVDRIGLLLGSLLANPSASPVAAALAMERGLSTVSTLLAHPKVEPLRLHVLRLVCDWFVEDAHTYLRHHALFLLSPHHTREKDEAVESAISQLSAIPRRSATQRCAAWIGEQLTYLSTHESRCGWSSSQTYRLCRTASARMTRLCGVVAYALSALPPSTSQSEADRRAAIDAICGAVCHAIYDGAGVAELCHHVVACSSPAQVGSTSATPCVTALLDSSSLPPPPPSSRSAAHSFFGSPLSPLRHADPTTAGVATQHRASSLSVLQRHVGTPLSPVQHNELITAMRGFTQQRRIHDAVALFYAHERQNRRLTRAEVELFADVARRSTSPFLVRLLTYLPPPCESAVMASALVTGAWRSYQRVLRRLPGRQRGDAEVTPPPVSSNRVVVECAWWECLAIAVQAMHLLPSDGSTSPIEPLDPQRHRALLSTMCRLVQSRPFWLSGPSTTAAARPAHTAVLVCRFIFHGSPSLRHRLQQGEWVRRSIAELQQTLSFCEGDADAETAVRAYLRFVGTHVPPGALVPGHLDGLVSLAVPLLSLDLNVVLLRMAATHAATPTAAASSTSKGWWESVAAGRDAVLHDGSTSSGDAPPPPPPPPQPTENTRRGNEEEEEEGDLARLYRLRAEMEKGEASSAATENIPAATPLPVLSAQRRTQVLQDLCAAAFCATSGTFPVSLRSRVEQHVELCPLTTVLHNALRWLQLRPRVLDLRTSSGNAALSTEGVEEEEEEDAASVNGTATAGAAVLTRLLAAVFHLDAMEVDVGQLLSRSSPVGSHPSQNTGCTCCAFTVRLPYEPSSWALVRHSDALFEYVLSHLQLLYAVEGGELWVSPAQERHALVALVECLQVVLAAMEALDGWAASYRAQLLHERGGAWAAVAASPLAAAEARHTAMEEIRNVQQVRVRLRETPAQFLKQLLRVDVSRARQALPPAAETLWGLLSDDLVLFLRCSPNYHNTQLLHGTASRQDNSAPETSEVVAGPSGIQDSSLDLLHCCTRIHYTYLTRLLASTVVSGTGSAAADCGWAGRRLAYMLNCLTADGVGCAEEEEEESTPQGFASNSSSSSNGSGMAQALLIRLSAADVTLQHLSRHLMDMLTEVTLYAPTASSTEAHRCEAEIMARFSNASHLFSQAAALLDECTAWWNALHLDGALARLPVDVTAVHGGTSGVNWSLLHRSLLDHVHREKMRLVAVLRDLYAVMWWRTVMPQVEHVCPDGAERCWSNSEARAEHLYVALVLHHRTTEALRVEDRRVMVCAAEKLQQALLRSSRSVKAAEENWYNSTVDMETLLSDEPTSADTRRSVGWKIEGALLRLLVQRSAYVMQGGEGGREGSTASLAFSVVPVAELEKAVGAALTYLSPRHAALLWRTLPLLLEAQRVCARGETRYDVPKHLWAVVTELAGASVDTDVTARDADVGLGVEGVLSVSLLSNTPCVVDGVVVSQLLRQHLQLGRGGTQNVSKEALAWLERLIAYGLDEAHDVGAAHSAVAPVDVDGTEAPQPISASYFAMTVAGGTQATIGATPVPAGAATSTATAAAPLRRELAMFLPVSSSLCRRLVPAIVTAVLRDTSFLSSTTTPTREAVLLRLVHTLGYTAPQAWPVALRWIYSTPYDLASPLSGGDGATHAAEGEVPPHVNEGSDHEKRAPRLASEMRAVEVCTLRRLQAAFSACGPWPANVARPLLAYAVELQRRVYDSVTPFAASSREVFPEAAELLALFRSAAGVVSNTEGLAVHPFMRPLCLTCTEPEHHRSNHTDAAAGLQVRTDMSTASVSYLTCWQEPLALHTAAASSRSARFRVTMSTLPPHCARQTSLPPMKVAGESIPEHGVRVVALSALQLASDMPASDPPSQPLHPPPELHRWVQQVAASSSLQACLRLLHTGAWREMIAQLPRRVVAQTLGRVWKVVLMRRVELVASGTAGETEQEEEQVWLRVCAALFVTICSVAQRYTGVSAHARTTRKLALLREEVCRFWASALLELLLVDSSLTALDFSSDDVPIRLNAFVASYASDTSNSRSRRGLRSHVGEALSVRDAKGTASFEGSTAWAQQAHAGLLRAVETLLHPQSKDSAGTATLQGSLRWVLWPPAAWELWQAARVQPSTDLPKGHLEVRNPLLAAAAIVAWRRRRGRLNGDRRGDALFQRYTDRMGSVFPFLLSTARGSKASASGAPQLSLKALWTEVDAFVRRDGRGAAVVIEAFLSALSAEDSHLRQLQGGRHGAGLASQGNAVDDNAVALKAVLRRVRPLLLGEAGSALLPSLNAWASYVPLSSGGEQSAASNSPWHTFLHVLHLCTSGMLDRSAERRGRRATPSAAAAACVTQKLEALLRQQPAYAPRAAEGETKRPATREGAHHNLRSGPPPLPPVLLLSLADGTRILCWQLRQLQRVQTHVNAQGWTMEQHEQWQAAQRHLRSSAAYVAALTAQRASKERKGEQLHGALEAATAACFYPHLAVLRKTTLERTRRKFDSPVKGDAEVTTAFPDDAALPRSNLVDGDDAFATALLGGLHNLLSSCQVGADVAPTPEYLQLKKDYAVVQSYLAAVLSGVARRQRTGSPQSLLDFLSGAETARVLRALRVPPSAAVRSLRHLVSFLLSHLASAPGCSRRAATSAAYGDAAVCAGLQLCLALQPWMPAQQGGCSEVGAAVTRSGLTDAALQLALAAVERTWRQQQRSTTSSHVSALVACVVHSAVVQQQAEALTCRGVALLGALQQELAQRGETQQEKKKHGGRRQGQHSVAPTDKEVLWHVVRGLSLMNECEAAEVHHAWRDYSLRRSSGTAAVKTVLHSRTASFVEGLYRDVVRLLHDTSCTTQSTLSVEGFYGATRLRGWWARDTVRGDVAQQHVLEDLLCLHLALDLHDTTTVSRAARVACVSTYTRYLALLTGYGGESSCPPTAVLALQLGISWRLLLQLPPTTNTSFSSHRRVNAVGWSGEGTENEHLLHLLQAVITHARSSVGRWPFGAASIAAEGGDEHSSFFAVAVHVAPHEDAYRIASHLLQSMTRVLRDAAHANPRTPGPPPPASSALFRDWEATVTPLRAVQLVHAAHRNGDFTPLRLTCTGRGMRASADSASVQPQEVKAQLLASVTPTLYITLRALVSTGQLLQVPLDVLLLELLLPLLAHEEGHMSTVGGGTTQLQTVNRVALLRTVAQQLPTHPALHRGTPPCEGTPTTTAIPSRLVAEIAAAMRLTLPSTEAALSIGAAPAASGVATAHADLHGWPAALLCMKVLARLDAALRQRGRVSNTSSNGGEGASGARSETSVVNDAAGLFAAHYAGLLSRRPDALHDYLAFALVARPLTAASSSLSSSSGGGATSAGHTKMVALEWPALLRAVTSAAAPASITALVEQFRKAGPLSPAVAVRDQAAVAAVAAVSHAEAQGLRRLCSLLGPSP